jgi:hypothetical protein
VKKTPFGPSKWPCKFGNRNTIKNSKLPKNCFEPHQLPGVINFAYDLILGCTIARWKGIDEEIHLEGSIKAFCLSLRLSIVKKTSFGPSKWP